jgi:hypothetical protein
MAPNATKRLEGTINKAILRAFIVFYRGRGGSGQSHKLSFVPTRPQEIVRLFIVHITAMDSPLNHPPNDSIAPKLLLSVGIIIGIGLPIYAARMYSRIRPQYKLSWDDYAISIAQVPEICLLLYDQG